MTQRVTQVDLERIPDQLFEVRVGSHEQATEHHQRWDRQRQTAASGQRRPRPPPPAPSPPHNFAAQRGQQSHDGIADHIRDAQRILGDARQPQLTSA